MQSLHAVNVAEYEFTREGRIEAEKATLRLHRDGLHARMKPISNGSSGPQIVVVVPEMERERARRVLGHER